MQIIYYDIKLLHYVAIFAMLIATSIWYYADIRGKRTLTAFHVFGVLTSVSTGYYLSKRLSYIVGPTFPNWLLTKYVLIFFIGLILPLLRTFKPQHNKFYFGLNVVLFIATTFVAIYKPF